MSNSIGFALPTHRLEVPASLHGAIVQAATAKVNAGVTKVCLLNSPCGGGALDVYYKDAAAHNAAKRARSREMDDFSLDIDELCCSRLLMNHDLACDLYMALAALGIPTN